MFLDELRPLVAQVGYGTLGSGGSLGYEGKRAMARGRRHDRALSTHPPARLVFHLGGRYSIFRSDVTIADDVPPGSSDATFIVLVDGREAARAECVAGNGVRTLVADISGASLLELSVRTARFPYAHALWLDPQLDEQAQESLVPITDCLERAAMTPLTIPFADRCIATVVSPGFERLLDDMLGSLVANGNCTGARLVIFAVDANSSCNQIAAKYGAALVPCRSIAGVNMATKAILYSAARVIPARQFLCLDADLIIAGDISPIFAALDALPRQTILACRDGNREKYRDTGEALTAMYGGRESDRELLAISEREARFPLVVNDGVFAASRDAMLPLDATIRAMPHAQQWMRDTTHVWWRNQYIFNLALARLGCGVELDNVYNLQLQECDVAFADARMPAPASWNGVPARILHFNGAAKRKYANRQGHYASAGKPLAGAALGDTYADFLAALRRWVGTHGVDTLSYSFYGTTDGQHGDVPDVSTLPLLAALHYLIRANGCVRVVECGTARGVSAACLASAVSIRGNAARVVTFDPFPYPERETLWNELPVPMRNCIEARTSGSIEGMHAALAAGERFEAALLDSVHTEEHVWGEFDIARQIVCASGLILVHDPIWQRGTVEAALQRIERDGYGVVRLWTAESGAREDDGLGLAVIENRRRRSS